MKKLLFILLLTFSFAANAKFYVATVHLTDGSTKAGYAELPGHTSSNLVFRATKDGKNDKIDNELIQTVDFSFEDGTAETYFCVYLGKLKRDRSVKKDKKKRWYGSIYTGKTDFLYFTQVGSIQATVPGYYYFLHTPGDDYAVSFVIELTGAQKMMNEKKMYKKMIEAHFVDRCPEMVEKSISGEFETKDINEVVAFFKAHCE